MTKHFLKTILLPIVVLFCCNDKVRSCSMYKITMNGKTMVGSNYDAYSQSPKIWFENGKNGDYGAAFTGGRFDGANGFAPQSGINEYGLTFSRLAAAPPENISSMASNKKAITNPTNYLKDILHKCKTIDEVKNYISQYDHSFLIEDVFIYIEQSGRYLIVEPDTMTIGNDAKYVLANFCPSTTDLNLVKQPRYVNGVVFLKNKMDTALSFCTALSDTMHVCRKKIGDGTLLTIIRDLNNGEIYLYFYHDYKHLVKFNLKDELAKGDYLLAIPDLFPPNAEFEKLCSYKTPQNSSAMMSLVILSGCVCLFSSMFFLVSFFRKRKTANYSYIKMMVTVLGLMLFYYMFVLATNQNIFYFPAPYQDYKFSMITVASYFPFLLLLIIIPLLIINLKISKEPTWHSVSKWLLTFNNLIYSTLIILFTYWGFYNIF